MTTQYTLPTYWASYLVNGDASGLETSEVRAVDEWLEREGDIGVCVDVSEDSWFAWRNDAGIIGGDVATFTFFQWGK